VKGEDVHLEITRFASRYIFIGDIHGCYDELVELLDKLNIGIDDIVISTGDFVDRGPKSRQCIELWIKNKFYAVLGNHDERYIRWMGGEKVTFAEDFESTIMDLALNKECLTFLQSLPLYISIPNINSVVTHAAVDITKEAIPDELQCNDRNIMLRGRYIRYFNHIPQYIDLGKETDDDILWCDAWKGPQVIVYGHTPRMDSKVYISDCAFGIDTGCVYGESLTALVYTLNSGWNVIQVKAKQKYFNLASKEKVVII